MHKCLNMAHHSDFRVRDCLLITILILNANPSWLGDKDFISLLLSSLGESYSSVLW